MNRKQRRADKGKGGTPAADTQKALHALFHEALGHQEAGRLADAERIYRHILSIDPRHAHSLYMMGLMAFDLKGYDIAADLVGQALAIEDKAYLFHNTMGNIRKAQGRLEDAMAGYRRAMALKPDFADAHNNLGVALIMLGRADEAMESYKRAIAADPNHADALNNMGGILQAQKKFDEAVEYYKRAAALKPESTETYNNLGNLLIVLNRYDEARACFERVIAHRPDHAEAHYNLGNLYRNRGQYDEALRYFSRAAVLEPDGRAYTNAGLILQDRGRLKEAIAQYELALALMPDSYEILNNIGMAYKELSRFDEALAYFERALAIAPDQADILGNIGIIYKNRGKLDQAVAANMEEAYRSMWRRWCAAQDPESIHIPDDDRNGKPSQNVFNTFFEDALRHHNAGRLTDATAGYKEALAIQPDSIDILNNFGVACMGVGKLDDARRLFERALAVRPDLAEAHFNLGNVLKALGEFNDAVRHYSLAASIKPYPAAHVHIGTILHYKGLAHEAIAQYEQALAIQPESCDALNGLGIAFLSLGDFEKAQDAYERALAIDQNSVDALNNLANVYKGYGRLEEAVGLFKRALAIAPARAATYDNLLMTLIYMNTVSPEDMATVARTFGERAADPHRRPGPIIRNRDPERRLRIGYVSPDFSNHAVNYFFEPLLTLHDRDRFEIFSYSNTVGDDAVMARLKRKFDHWRDIRFMSDDQAADQVEADAIDILVDMAGHTGENRLLVFARKPAPVQISWLGYPATTGMKTMDYRITDRFTEPPGLTEHLNTEALWRLPEIFCCYQPHDNSPAPAGHAPFEDNGYVTFGCFNNFLKVTDQVLSAWAQIMAQVPDARLLLEISRLDNAKFMASVEDRLARCGLPRDRVILEPRKKANQYVLYNRIDIALDPFPSTGGTTSMDTLWMNVPFITLAGKHFVSRMGVSILNNIGMPELVARDLDDYIRLAVDLARDKDRLRSLRRNLRGRMAASPLMNQQSFTRAMEDAYRGMWRKWCETRQ